MNTILLKNPVYTGFFNVLNYTENFVEGIPFDEPCTGRRAEQSKKPAGFYVCEAKGMLSKKFSVPFFHFYHSHGMIMIYMMSHTFFKRAFAFLAITGALNWIGVTLYLYWSFWWYDIVMHFLGGLTLGFATLWLMSIRNNINFSLGDYVRIALVGGICIGIAWEIFELYYHVTTFADGIYYVTDTTGDLIMDSVGAIVAGLWAYNIHKKND